MLRETAKMHQGSGCVRTRNTRSEEDEKRKLGKDNDSKRTTEAVNQDDMGRFNSDNRCCVWLYLSVLTGPITSCHRHDIESTQLRSKDLELLRNHNHVNQ